MSEAAVVAAPRVRHPKGLPYLFFTEMWERFSFYTMASLLVLYMDESLHFKPGLLSQIYGLYVGLVYFLPLFGGYLADRRLGFHRAVIAGGVLMMLGHLSLAVESLPFFFTGLTLLVCGSGLLKPNVSTMLGELYRDRPEKRDSGFNLFYMGINIGAFFGPLSASYLRHHYSWRMAFASAGLGMVFALAIFVSGLKWTRVEKLSGPAETAATEVVSASEAKERIGALLVIFGIAVFFWVAFYQYSYTITLWVRDSTRTTLSPEVTQSIDPLFIISFTPLLVLLWAYLNKRGKEPRTPAKMLFGMLATSAAFGTVFLAAQAGGDHGRVSLSWTVVFYAFLAFAEICVSPMGLSLVSRVAPPGKRGMLMGAWFVTLGLGGYLSGPVGKLWFDLPHSTFFAIVAAGALVAAILLMLTARRLNRVIDKTT